MDEQYGLKSGKKKHKFCNKWKQNNNGSVHHGP